MMFGRKKKIEEMLALENVDPYVCQEALKGEVDKYGRCMVRAKISPDNPNKVELESLRLVEGGPKPRIREEAKE
jgi:hypothetical protein